MLKKSKKVLAMDFGTRSIKIAEGSFKKGKLSVARTFVMDLPTGVYEDGHILDTDAIGQALDSFLRINGVKTEETIAVVNSSDILTRDITVPNVSEEEIEGILRYKITDYIPIDPEDYIVQWINEGTIMESGNEKIKLFIIAMLKSIAEGHFNLLKNLDLKPKVLDFQSNAIRKLIYFSEKNSTDSIVDGKTIASLDIGYFSSKVTILKQEKIEISRIIPLGVKDILENIDYSMSLDRNEVLNYLLDSNSRKGKDLDSDEGLEITRALTSFLSRLFENLEMVFRYYNSQEQNNEVNLIMLQGSIVNILELKERFENYLNIKTISIDSLTGIVDKDLYLYSNAIGSLIRGEMI